MQAQIAQSQGEIDLDKARKDAIHSMAQFVTGAGAGSEAGGLRGQIDAMAASVPSSAAGSPNGNQANSKDPANTNAEAAATEPAGIWDLGEELLAISRKLGTIDAALTQIEALAKTSSDLRAPFTNRLRTLSRQADDLAGQPPAKDPSAVTQQREQVASLTTEFKQLAAVALPLSKQGILLGLYQKSLENWHTEVRGDLKGQLERLLARLAILAVFIGVVLVFAEIGKRAIYRYVHEPHRRYQFLLLRKILLAFAIVVMVGFAFASRLESAVTFAGLLTAGLAVALQSVLVSVVGYFFLIGKYGIRVGDRVQISGVTGEVVDIGLVRMQVMELGGTAVNTPTGRVVAFSNAIVFQPTAGLFKQIPGTNFVWHELSLTLAVDSDFHVVRERLLKGVDAALADFHDEMQRQNRAMERNLIAAPVNGLSPKVHLRLTASGLEALVRFAVDFQHASDIDERVMSELLKALEEEPKLTLAGDSAQISVRTNPPQAGAAAAG
jgi:small-conductance mechanosensitive channel